MEDEFFPEFKALIAAMLDNITPRYTSLTQLARWQLIKLVAIAVIALLVLYGAFRLFVYLRMRKKDRRRLAQFRQILADVEGVLCGQASGAGGNPDGGGRSSGSGGPVPAGAGGPVPDKAPSFVRQCAALGEQIDRHTNRPMNSRLVAMLSWRIACGTKMNAEQAAICFCSALTADIGLLDLPRSLFFREHLTRKERKLLRTQVQRAVSSISSVSFIPTGYLPFFIGSCLYRRENYDGSGYPEGLAGSAIPVLARIVRAVEDYTAMTEWRVYGHIAPLSPRAAVRELKKSAGLYDQRIVSIIEKLV
ncbi:MAG: hypothetical protein II932_03965 [Treponema sp.]|nr:hypothetical protein [Treponema sp.]